MNFTEAVIEAMNATEAVIETMNVTDALNVTETVIDVVTKKSRIDGCINIFYRQCIRYFLHFVVCFGFIGNLISFYIFINFTGKRSINVFLAALSISDTGVCGFRVVRFFTSMYAFGRPIGYVLLSVQDTFLFASVYTLILSSIDRYLAICHPFLVQRYCTGRRAKIAVVIAYVWASLIAIGWMSFIRISEASKLSDLVMKAVVAIYLTLMSILPACVLSITNYMVARTILSTKQIAVSSREKKEYSTARMMLYIVIVFLVSNSLRFLSAFLIPMDDYFANLFVDHINYIGHFMIAINSASTCVFYYCYSTRYKERLYQMFGIKSANQRKESCGTDFSSSMRSSRMSRRSTRTSFVSHREAPSQAANRLLEKKASTSE